MGIFFKKEESYKTKYYKLLKKSIKNLYDKNRYNTFNQAYSLHLNKFAQRRNSTKLFFDEIINMDISWKYFLLQKLQDSFNNEAWKKSLYNFVNKEQFPYQYIFQNRIFFEEFSLLTKPKSNKKSESVYSLQTEPILSSLDTKELKSLSKSISSFCINPSLIENEYTENSENYDQHLIMNITMESITSSMINKDPKYEAQLNSYKIKKYIQIIKRHLDNKNHPINVIITEYINLFSPCLKEAANFCEANKTNKEECSKKGRDIIKQIQEFIEIMQVVLKLFYSKSINYRYFIDEKDEIINLISYILFNVHNIYRYVKTIFRCMNYEKIEKLEFQFQKLGDLTPKEIGIDPKFCLDKETDEYMEELLLNKNNLNINIRNNSQVINNDQISENNKNKVIRKSSKVSKLVEFFESNNKDKNGFNDIDMEKNLEKEGDNISINTEKSKNNKKIMRHKGYNKINSFETNDDEEEYSPSYKLQDFRKNIESFKDKMNIKELLINNIENECYPNLPKIPNFSQKKSNQPYLNAINYLGQIDTYKAPLEKLIVIALISVIITDCIDKYWDSFKNDISPKFLNINADELMSIYLYIIYKLKSPSLFVHLDFIKYFTTPISKQSMIGYYFTALEGCLNFILNIEDKNSLVKK